MMSEQEMFIEMIGLFKFMRFLAERLSFDEYEMIALLETDYLNVVLDEYALHIAIQELDQRKQTITIAS